MQTIGIYLLGRGFISPAHHQDLSFPVPRSLRVVSRERGFEEKLGIIIAPLFHTARHATTAIPEDEDLASSGFRTPFNTFSMQVQVVALTESLIYQSAQLKFGISETIPTC